MINREKTLEDIFVSKVRVKALRYFLLNPTRPLHLRGAVREFKEEINAVRRELMRLEHVKILETESKGNRKIFRLNILHPFVTQLMGLFHQTYGLGGEIISLQKRIGEIQFAVFTSAFTQGTYIGDQKIDLVLIGVLDMSIVEKVIAEYELKTGREVHYTVMRPSEFELRKRRKDQFIVDLLVQEMVMLIGSHEEFIK